jgi:hypothetical protein
MYNDRRRNPQLYDDIRRQKPRRNRPNQENEHDGSDNQEVRNGHSYKYLTFEVSVHGKIMRMRQ